MGVATGQSRFTPLMRFFHWLTAALVLTMLGIGLAMVASLAYYHRLISIHRPLGILVLIVVVLRFINRRRSTLPPFPETMSPQERLAASASELLLYSLLFLLPLVGWGMLSAARYPIVLYGSMHFPPDTSAQRPAVRRVAQDAHDSGLPFISGIPRPYWRRSVSHSCRARWTVQPYGALESPRALVRFGDPAAGRIPAQISSRSADV